MEFKVDKKVKMPAFNNGRGQPTKYPFRSMAVGDSFFVDGDEDGRKALVSASQFGRRNGLKFRSAKEGNGRRIWRIE